MHADGQILQSPRLHPAALQRNTEPLGTVPLRPPDGQLDEWMSRYCSGQAEAYDVLIVESMVMVL